MEKAAVSLSRDISGISILPSQDASTLLQLLRAGLARGEVAKQLDSLCERSRAASQKGSGYCISASLDCSPGPGEDCHHLWPGPEVCSSSGPPHIERINSDLAEISRVLVDLEQEMKSCPEVWYARRLSESCRRSCAWAAPEIRSSKMRPSRGGFEIPPLFSGGWRQPGHAMSDEGRRVEEP